MNLLKGFVRSVVAALVTATLMSCQPRGVAAPTHDEKERALEQRASQLVRQGNYRGAAEIYWVLAYSKESPLREEYQIQAAELVLSQEMLDLARDYLSVIDESLLDETLLVRKRLADAELALLMGQPEAALLALPERFENVDPVLIKKSLEVRMRAFEMQLRDLDADSQLRNVKQPTH